MEIDAAIECVDVIVKAHHSLLGVGEAQARIVVGVVRPRLKIPRWDEGSPLIPLHSWDRLPTIPMRP
jgi:hypothetical protein